MGVMVAASACTSSTCVHNNTAATSNGPSSSLHQYYSSLPAKTTIRRSSTIGNLAFWMDQRSPFLSGGNIQASAARSAGLLRSRSVDNTSIEFCFQRKNTIYENHHASLRRSASSDMSLFPLHEEEDNNDANVFIRKLQNLSLPASSTWTPAKLDTPSSSYAVDTKPPRWLAGIMTSPEKKANVVTVGDRAVDIVQKNGNRVDLSMISLHMMKKKKEEEEEEKITLQGEAFDDGYCCTAYSSVKKAFSSMVLIIRELQSYTLELRELLFFEEMNSNMQGIVLEIEREMHASFCWLFQQIFACTPTLMLSVMLLLANFAVHSMAINSKYPSTSFRAMTAAASSAPQVSVKEQCQQQPQPRQRRRTLMECATCTDDSLEERVTWKRIVEEAESMQAGTRHAELSEKQTLLNMVAPVTAKIEEDVGISTEYFKTELTYRMAVAEEPKNSLLLCNFAQFLYLVLRDHDRAEHYFKRAVEMTPADGESLSRYANFLWLAKKDLCAAEDSYLQAIAADPNNTAMAANYAHFLWSTGGEDTCFPTLEA